MDGAGDEFVGEGSVEGTVISIFWGDGGLVFGGSVGNDVDSEDGATD